MKWAEATQEAALHIAMNLREEDRTEVWLSHGLTPTEAVMESWSDADLCRCIASMDDEPLALTGLTGNRIWLLGTEKLTATRERRLQLCKEGGEWVETCLNRAGMAIGNDVYAKNTRSIRWLKHLGFSVASPRPMGPSAELFSEFWRAA
jgi:hypothetical protein